MNKNIDLISDSNLKKIYLKVGKYGLIDLIITTLISQFLIIFFIQFGF